MERAGQAHVRTSPPKWHRLAGALLLIGTITLSLLYFQQNALSQARENAYETLQQSTNNQVRLFRSMSDSRVTNMQELAGWFAQSEPTNADTVQGLLQSTRNDGGYYRTWLMATDGTAISNDGQTIDVSDMSCYSNVMAGGSGIDCVTSRLNGEWVCIIWAPIVRAGNVEGAVFSSLDANKFRDQLLSEAFGQDSYSYVCDSTGNVVIGTESNLAGDDLGVSSGQNILDDLSDATFSRGSIDGLREALAEGASGTMSLTNNGRARLAVYQPMGIDDWTIVTAVNQSAVDAQVNEYMTGIYLLIAAILGLTFAFVIFVSVMVRRTDASRLFDAKHDRLTGLLNLDTFMDEAQEMVSRALPSTYMLCNIDIDGFRSINEQYGYDEGNRLIKRLAELIASDPALEGGLSCRDSADSFLALVPTRGADPRSIVADTSWNETCPDLPIHATVRTGIYLIDDRSEHMGLMMERSLFAQQSVRGRADRHVALYDSVMHERTEHERQVAHDMEPALKRGEFVAFVQPQYDHSSRSIVSAEALVRWVHPERGLIPPDEFIPVFERNGFIPRLDANVWEQVCAWIADRRDAGLPSVPISVNISRAEMEDDTILETLDRLVDEYAIDPAYLRLEVTESAYGEASGQVVDLTRKLAGRGFLIEMDDFGKGSSSLNSLKDIPVNVLKLDMRFLSPSMDEDLDERGSIMLGSVIEMAHDLGMDVIAEGVETQEQSDRLASMGCNVMQGYLYARPMPFRDFEGLLNA